MISESRGIQRYCSHNLYTSSISFRVDKHWHRKQVEVSWTRGTPSHHPSIDGIFMDFPWKENFMHLGVPLFMETMSFFLSKHGNKWLVGHLLDTLHHVAPRKYGVTLLQITAGIRSRLRQWNMLGNSQKSLHEFYPKVHYILILWIMNLPYDNSMMSPLHQHFFGSFNNDCDWSNERSSALLGDQSHPAWQESGLVGVTGRAEDEMGYILYILIWEWVKTLLLSIWVGWTSIFQLFWGSLATRVLTAIDLMYLGVEVWRFTVMGVPPRDGLFRRRNPMYFPFWETSIWGFPEIGVPPVIIHL